MIDTRKDSFAPAEGSPLAPAASLSNAELLTSMSHEMRTPLSAILGFAQLIESGTPAPTFSQRKSIDRILQAGWYLESLINMTHDLALIESGTLSLTLESIPLATVMTDCQAMLSAQAQVRGVRLTLPVLDTSLSVSADRLRLQEVLGYVLSAVIGLSEAGAEVVVTCEARASRSVRIGVSDPALPAATAVDETGIGMLLAKRLVELMGGAISEDRRGGSRQAFAFDLQCMASEVDAASATLVVDQGARETSAPQAVKGYMT